MKYLLFLIVVFLTACQSDTGAENPSEQSNNAVASGSANSTPAVAVTLEGKTMALDAIDWAGSKAKISANAISLGLQQKGNPLKLELEIADAGLLERGSTSFTLPLTKKGDLSVDLSLIDSSRPGIAMKQRVLFSEGTIEIKAVTTNSLQMVFKGTGHALMDSKKFPIEGSVNITF